MTIRRPYRALLLTAMIVGFSGPLLPEENDILYPIMRKLRTGFIDGTGTVVIEPKFDIDRPNSASGVFTSEGLYPVRNVLKWGYADKRGILKIPFQFSLAAPFSEGLAAVRIEREEAGRLQSKYGFVDTSGRVKIPDRFDEVGNFSEGLAFVVIGSTIGYIDKSGAFAIPLRPFQSYSPESSSFSEGLVALSSPRSASDMDDSPAVWGFVDRTGAWVIPPSYTSVSAFHDGLAVVTEKRDKGAFHKYYKFINQSGETVAGPYVMAWRFSEGLARIQTEDGRLAFIDTKGQLVFTLDSSVRWVEPFSQGLAAAQVRWEKTGYIDRTGRFVIPAVYDRGLSFMGPLAFVSICGQEGYIDTANRPVWGIKARKETPRSIATPSPGVLTSARVAAIANVAGGVELQTTISDEGLCDFLGRRFWSVNVKSHNNSFPQFSISLAEGGTYLTEERMETFREMQAKSGENSWSRQIGPRNKPIGYITVIGFGPGGSGYVASVFSPDQRFEIQIRFSVGRRDPQPTTEPRDWGERVALGVRDLLFGSEQ